MTSGQGPAGSRRRLGAELRRLRTNAHLHLDQVAAEVPCSASKISRLETGKGSPKLADVRRLMEIYGVTSETESDMLQRLVRDSRGRGWWEPYTDGVTPERFVLDSAARYTALETDASAVHAFDVIALHGLMQTPAYAHAVLEAFLPQHSEEEIEQLVELRARRQEAITRSVDPLVYSAVVDESMLTRFVGGPATMVEQLRAIQRLVELPNVTIQVFPFTGGMHRAHVGHFSILEFADGTSPDLVYVEGPAGDQYLDGESDVVLYKDVLADAAAKALPPAASLRLVGRYLDDLERAAQ